MANAMVTARMTSEKKEAGNRVLEQLDTNVFQAVNKLYDYVLENKELPFHTGEKRIEKSLAKNYRMPPHTVGSGYEYPHNATVSHMRADIRYNAELLTCLLNSTSRCIIPQIEIIFKFGE